MERVHAQGQPVREAFAQETKRQIDLGRRLHGSILKYRNIWDHYMGRELQSAQFPSKSPSNLNFQVLE